MIATGFTVSSIRRHFTKLACLALVAFASGCAVGDDSPGGTSYPEQDDISSEPNATPSKNVCQEGAVRGCEIVIGVHNGVKSCVVGKSQCVEGSWTSCEMDDA